ncbi:MAG: hypothetical protein WC381_11120 [Kiritimatiellia bacterium]|jgi:hypothetical protein
MAPDVVRRAKRAEDMERPLDRVRAQVRALAATLNGKTCWSKVKKELMEIAK